MFAAPAAFLIWNDVIMNMKDAYRLSRIQAEGWNAARNISSSDLAGLDLEKIDALNPYRTDPEKARWSAGFVSARDAATH